MISFDMETSIESHVRSRSPHCAHLVLCLPFARDCAAAGHWSVSSCHHRHGDPSTLLQPAPAINYSHHCQWCAKYNFWNMMSMKTWPMSILSMSRLSNDFEGINIYSLVYRQPRHQRIILSQRIKVACNELKCLISTTGDCFHVYYYYLCIISKHFKVVSVSLVQGFPRLCWQLVKVIQSFRLYFLIPTSTSAIEMEYFINRHSKNDVENHMQVSFQIFYLHKSS